MLTTRHFAWAHLPKAAGDATQQMLEGVPGLVEWAHSPDTNAKHDPFALHEDAISGRLRVMNIRRLPAWILSMAQHRAVHGTRPTYEPDPMPSAAEMAEATEPDDVLRFMTDGPRFPVQWWLRKERLADDVAALLGHFDELTDAARAAIAAVPYRAKGYDHDLAATFTGEQIGTMYALNPGWAEVERKVYGGLYELDRSGSPGRRRRPTPAPIAGPTGPGREHPAPGAQGPSAGERPQRTPGPDRDEIEVSGWLRAGAGRRLDAIDRQLAREGPRLDSYRHFRGLEDWVWALLLGRRYSSYLSIRETLPHVPSPALQERSSGAHGLTLLGRSLAFYRHVRAMQSGHGVGDRPTARILDFGCGWGRLTRFFCRDVDLGCLHACDFDEELLRICRRSRLPAVLHRTEPAPGELPERDFDLAYALTAFTRGSREDADRCLEALHGALRPGGLLVLTVGNGAEPVGAAPSGGTMSLGHLRERWSGSFEEVDVTVAPEDIDHGLITLRRI